MDASAAAPAEPHAVRIVVADDHQIVRDGFARLLDSQPEFTVVGTAGDGAEAVRVCRAAKPDVVLMDVRMPVLDGIEATRRLAAENGPRSLILTTFDLDEYVYEALRAGASGFLLKDTTAERLFDAVHVVAAGDALLAPAVTRRLIREFAARRPAASAVPAASTTSAGQEAPGRGRIDGLTPRETEVLKHVAAGLSNTEIAERLVVAEETVKTHVSRILGKLGLRDRTQAVVAAYESGLVVPGSAPPRPGRDG
jgi:DNA-binding NarL/FixJ family response regulator